jgi:nucleotide-binding universal stress UspA family protein
VNRLMNIHEKKSFRESTFLVAIDFSDCSREALRRTKSFLAPKPSRIIAIHVIDSDFITECIRHELGDEGQIKKKLFLEAKAKLRDFLKQENMEKEHIEMVVCEGVPFLEINKKAVENDVDIIIIGSCSKTGGMSQIFFGSTAEKVLRFITRPVLCIPPESEYRTA